MSSKPGERRGKPGRSTGGKIKRFDCYPSGAVILTQLGADILMNGGPATVCGARVRAARLGRDVDLCEGDAQHRPFGDASFDTVACALSLCAIPGPVAAVGHMRRVLRPGGRLLLDHVGSTRPPVYAAQRVLPKVRPLLG